MRMYDSVRVKFQRLQVKSRSSALCTDLGTRPCAGGGGGGSIGGDDDGRLAGPPFPTLLADGNDLAAIVHAIHNGILKNGVLTHGGAGLLVQSTPGGGKSTLLKALARHYRGHVCAQLSGRDLSGQSSGDAAAKLLATLPRQVHSDRRILLIDDLDDLLCDSLTDPSAAATKSESTASFLLSAMSHVLHVSSNRRVFVVATCTRIGDIPPELRLPHILGTAFLLRKPSEARMGQFLKTSLGVLRSVPSFSMPDHVVQSISMDDVAFRWRMQSVAAIIRMLRDNIQRHTMLLTTRRLWSRATDYIVVGLNNAKQQRSIFHEELILDASMDTTWREFASEDGGTFRDNVVNESNAAIGSVAFDCPLINISAQQDLLERSVLSAMRRVHCQKSFDLNCGGASGTPLPCTPCTGIIIHGPSGTGKTALAHWLVEQSQLSFVSISCADLIHKAVGDSERAIASIFEAGRRSAPCFLILDNIEMIVGLSPLDCRESIGARRGRTSHAALDRVLSTLLAEIDGLARKQTRKEGGGTGRKFPHHSSGAVIVVATTSDISQIDRALLRPGRLEVHVALVMPSTAEQTALSKHFADLIRRHFDSTARTANDAQSAMVDNATRILSSVEADFAALIHDRALCWSPASIRQFMNEGFFSRMVESVCF